MKLSEIGPDLSLRVVRDGVFSSLGFAGHRRPGMLTYLASEDFTDVVARNDTVSCVIAVQEVADQVPQSVGLAVVGDSRLAFYRLHNHLATATSFYGQHHEHNIASTARVHPTAFIAPNVLIEDEVEIGPHAVVLSGVSIGAESVIRAGTVIGSEGFQVIRAGDDVI